MSSKFIQSQTIISKVIQLLAEEVAPLVVAMDNLHHADPHSLALLKALLNSENKIKMHVILTREGERPVELDSRNVRLITPTRSSTKS